MSSILFSFKQLFTLDVALSWCCLQSSQFPAQVGFEILTLDGSSVQQLSAGFFKRENFPVMADQSEPRLDPRNDPENIPLVQIVRWMSTWSTNGCEEWKVH